LFVDFSTQQPQKTTLILIIFINNLLSIGVFKILYYSGNCFAFSFDTQSLLSYTFSTQKSDSIHTIVYVLSNYENDIREKCSLFQTGEPAVLINCCIRKVGFRAP